MFIKRKIVQVFDIEVLPNCFTVTFLNSETEEIKVFEISERKCENRKLISFIADNVNNYIYSGYNIRHYDNLILNYVILYLNSNKHEWSQMCSLIYNLSRLIITDKTGEYKNLYNKYKYADIYEYVDLATMLFPRKLMASLKSLEITMHYKNVREMVIDWNKDIPSGRIQELLDYNLNDVMATFELLKRSEKNIRIRESIEKEYGINCLSLDDVTTGVSILEYRYRKESGVSPSTLLYDDEILMNDVVFEKIQFNSKILQELLEELKSFTYHWSQKGKKSFEKEFIFNGTKYSFGIGGLHSINRPIVIIPNEDEELIEEDAESLYPNMILKNECAPRHLGEAFLKTYQKILDDRLIAKHSKDEVTNGTLKFCLNGVSGNMDRIGSWLYDPLQVLKIRINGQLLFLMLVEKLTEAGIKVISANTDGIVALIPKKKKEEYLRISSEWESFSHLKLEYTEYEKLVMQGINSYLAIKKGFSENKGSLEREELFKRFVKTKNKFLLDVELGKGLITPRIVSKAIVDYYIYGTKIEETIKGESDFRMFLMSQKTDSKFKIVHGVNENIQLYNRFYVSKKGAYLKKYTNDPRNADSIITQPVLILNDFDTINGIEDLNIDFSYYNNECRKLIYSIEPLQLSLF